LLGFNNKFIRPPTHPSRPIMMNNAGPPSLTAAAGTVLVCRDFLLQIISLLIYCRKSFTAKKTTVSSLMKYCWIKLSPIVQNSSLQPHNKSLDLISVPMWLGRPSRPAKDHRLGKPLPYQLPNLVRAHLKAINLFNIFGLSQIPNF
jgi:hypothetical protein